MRIKCLGYHTKSTPDCPSEFECGYENSSGFCCEDCICNGGDMSPQTGKLFRGNPKPYIDAVLERQCREHTLDLDFLMKGML